MVWQHCELCNLSLFGSQSCEFDCYCFRKIKTSFCKEKICTLPAYEKLSNHWKAKIVPEAQPLYEKNTDIINGMFYDPGDFLPRHMSRWLERRELEGFPLPPGCYKVKFKVRIVWTSWDRIVYVGNL